MLLIGALAVCAGLCLWVLNASICIGRIETRTDGLWSQLHVYMNDEITVVLPVERAEQTFLFQYETGRGSFSVEITDAEGNLLHSDQTDESGRVAFQSNSDVTLRIKGDGHGGIFSLMEKEGKPGDSGLLRDGVYSGELYTATYELHKADGDYLNFYVDNRGQDAVVISVNDDYNRTIPADESAHIRVPISVSVMSQTMTVKCVSISDEDINIYWRVAQRFQDAS